MGGRGYAAVVGTFDGVHCGHRFLVDKLKAWAHERGFDTRVYTFGVHPLSILAPGKEPGSLDSPGEKVARLSSLGVDEVNMLDFKDVCQLTAREFIVGIAAEGVRMLVIGYDNRFGSDGLRELHEFIDAARGLGVEIVQAPELVDDDGNDINSTVIRRCLSEGDVARAARLLGYLYELTGEVVPGKQLGRTIGFPTANVSPDDGMKLIPSNGVYACGVAIDGCDYPAMVNIGTCPTVDGGGSRQSIEAHIIGYDGDLYGRTLTLRFMERLRDEKKFGSVDELRSQLEHDRLATLKVYRCVC